MTTRDDIALALTDPNAEPWEFPRPPLPSDPSMRAALTARRAGPQNYPEGKIGALAEMLAPSTPLDYGLMLAGGPVGRAAGKAFQIGSIVGGAALTGDEAYGGPASKALKATAKKPITPGELAELGLYPTTMPRKIFEETKGGGYSVNLPSGVVPTEGLMMGRYKNTDPRNMVLSPEEFKQAHIRQQAATNAKALAEPEAHFGTWKDPDVGGKIYLDVSQRFAPDQIRQATKFGEKTEQKAGWNIGAQQSFPVGNWRQFVASPEFHGRMNEMADVGNQYLKQFPTKEWWDMHGTTFERAYGDKNLPQVAGFSATTAPVTAPRENMQIMSEYMRRYLSGEPVVQPDWRVPAGTMSRAEGKMMPMETGRAANLERTARGALDELQRAKVSHEARAMSGDPTAVVLDRHWARLTEAPERGIYANTQEGVIDTNRRVRTLGDYDFVVAEVTKAAQARNRDPRDFSADAWTGIRETIKNTGELFGTKHKGSAITGESMSYADHLDQLIKDKAAHMGITTKELDKRLQRGEANLLSTMLVSSPVLATAYRQWEQSQKQDGGS